jgi:ribosomal protein L29
MKEPLEQKSREELEREMIDLKRQLVEAYEIT